MSQVQIVVGLGFGDEGKGSVVDYLVRKHGARLVVRFNGGGQAAHHVVTQDGRHHCFSQFGSGTFVPGVRTHLSRHVLLNPLSLLREETHLRTVGVEDAFSRFTVAPDALVTTPIHVVANRLREEMRDSRHGSVGMGIGETMKFAAAHPEHAIVAGDLQSADRMARRLSVLLAYYEQEFGASLPMDDWRIDEIADELFAAGTHVKLVHDADLMHEFRSEPIVFEGAQGVLLDETYGFPPHQTYSTCTFKNALELVPRDVEVRKIGVLRSYATRHGAGPFPTELPYGPKDEHNGEHPYQGTFRVGAFDMSLARYAIRASGATELALTHMDRWSPHVCTVYRVPDSFEPFEFKSDTTRERQTRLGITLANASPVYATFPTSEPLAVSMLERVLETPVRLLSYGKTADHKVERR